MIDKLTKIKELAEQNAYGSDHIVCHTCAEIAELATSALTSPSPAQEAGAEPVDQRTTRERLEPNLGDYTQETALTSIAISMKRIADALEK